MMNRDEKIDNILDELLKLLQLEYGSIEIRVHDSKITHYCVTIRNNRKQ